MEGYFASVEDVLLVPGDPLDTAFADTLIDNLFRGIA